MNYQTPVIGILSAVGVLIVLAAARFFVSNAAPVELNMIREVELTTLEEPPPPPPPPPEDPPPAPPPPALTNLADVPDPTRIPLPEADVPQRIDLPVDPFYIDQAPAPLPVTRSVVSRPNPRPAARPTPTPVRPRVPAVKSHYSTSELDGRPRLLHHPSVTFPRELIAEGVRAGTVTLEVELNTSGRVTVRRVISASHDPLVAKARYIASRSRFTPPKRNGQPVKAIMRWPITIKQ